MPDFAPAAVATTPLVVTEANASARIGAPLVNRNVTVRGKRTSIRLEPEMWEAIAEIRRRERCSLTELCAAIHGVRGQGGFTLAVRCFILDYFRRAATEDGHARAGHGFHVRALRGRGTPLEGLHRPV